MLIPILQQTTTPAPTPTVDFPASIQAVILTVLLYSSREIPARFITYLDLRIQERKKRVDALDTAYKRIDKLSDEVDKLLRRVSNAEESAERANQRTATAERNLKEQGDRHDREIADLGEKYTKMTEQYDAQGVLLSTSAARIKTLEEEKQELARQRDEEARKRIEAEARAEGLQLEVAHLTEENSLLQAKVKRLQTGELNPDHLPPDEPKSDPSTPS